MGIALLIAFALSLDGFGVGMSYGLRKIRIPLSSMFVIAFCTVVAMGISMIFGDLLVPWLTIAPPRIFGALLLIGIGGVQLYQALFQKPFSEEAIPVFKSAAFSERTYKPVLKINLNFFGLVIQVLRTPDTADMDGSGTISSGESFLLGCALALDAFASGVAASMAGIPFYVIGLAAVMLFVMIRLGQICTGRLPSAVLKKARFLPGAVLVLIGSLKLI